MIRDLDYYIYIANAVLSTPSSQQRPWCEIAQGRQIISWLEELRGCRILQAGDNMIKDLEKYIDIKSVALKTAKRVCESYKTETAKQKLQEEIDQEEQVLAWLGELVKYRQQDNINSTWEER